MELKTSSLKERNELQFDHLISEKLLNNEAPLQRRSSFDFDAPEGAKAVLLGNANDTAENPTPSELGKLKLD